MVASSKLCAPEYVREWADTFLALFPHRYDYIYAEHVDPTVRPEWKTERRYPLSDRLIQSGQFLYGVRFGSETQYALLDIDITSNYHPRRDPFAIARILAALEPLGLVSAVICTSSYSGGLHLYLPFASAVKSWELAIALSSLIERAGFCLKPGQLEIFPNPRNYQADQQLALFNAHRLPLQAGSYLVNAEFEPVWSDSLHFVQRWHQSQHRNELDLSLLKRLVRQYSSKHYRLSGKADKFIADLNAEIEQGWTDYGQTNRLLGRITMRAYIFHHVLHGGLPLSGAALVQQVVSIARSLPGYTDWCRHQHEIEQRAAEWASCIENSHYFPYSTGKGKYKAQAKVQPDTDTESSVQVSWNQQQSLAARDRIHRAIADLMEKQSLPASPTARFRVLLGYGIGGGSLYRHRDLWHPAHLNDPHVLDAALTPVENPPDPPTFEDAGPACAGGAASPANPTSLLPENGGDSNGNAGSGDRPWADPRQAGNNFAVHHERQRIRAEAHQKIYVERMQRYLESGDPILIAEALTWAQVNPGALNVRDYATPKWQIAKRPVEPFLFVDLSEAIAEISVHIRRLRWTLQDVCDRLQVIFGKRLQAMLTDSELIEWLAILRNWETSG